MEVEHIIRCFFLIFLGWFECCSHVRFSVGIVSYSMNYTNIEFRVDKENIRNNKSFEITKTFSFEQTKEWEGMAEEFGRVANL